MCIRDSYYNDPIDLLSLIGGSRLGTTVKKLWVIGGIKSEKDETQVDNSSTSSFYSVEWAGFG